MDLCQFLETQLPAHEKKWGPEKYKKATKRQIYDRKINLEKKIKKNQFLIDYHDDIEKLRKEREMQLNKELIEAQNRVKDIQNQIKQLDKYTFKKVLQNSEGTQLVASRIPFDMTSQVSDTTSCVSDTTSCVSDIDSQYKSLENLHEQDQNLFKKKIPIQIKKI